MHDHLVMSGQSERVGNAISARQTMNDDFFGGWGPEDAALFARYAHKAAPVAGAVVDFLGVSTSPEMIPAVSRLVDHVSVEYPIPDDGFRAEAIEYFALLDSLERASPDAYTICEVGASFAPWACTGAKVALRSGLGAVRAWAVEASPYMASLIPKHFADNDLTGRCEMKVICGAVSTNRWPLYFPKVASVSELGGQAVAAKSATDYVGRKVEYERVRAYRLKDVLPPGRTDLLHIDIQGAERRVLPKNAKLLNERVAAVFVGTHSRLIEGELITMFHENGWTLARERPTKFAYVPDRPDVVGWTIRDGGQYWINPRMF